LYFVIIFLIKLMQKKQNQVLFETIHAIASRPSERESSRGAPRFFWTRFHLPEEERERRKVNMELISSVHVEVGS